MKRKRRQIAGVLKAMKENSCELGRLLEEQKALQEELEEWGE